MGHKIGAASKAGGMRVSSTFVASTIHRGEISPMNDSPSVITTDD
jgi:hypothetical protein